MLALPDSIRTVKLRGKTLYLCEGVEAEAVLDALETPGEMLKDGDKRIVRKVGDWVIKESRFNKGAAPVKMTANRSRYRNGWLSSLEMMRLELPIPKTIAYVERRVAGVILSNAFIYAYIPDAVPLSDFAESLRESEREACHQAFYTALAKALQQLADARVMHRDLKPLNILTADGKHFYFIDLDEAFCDIEFQAAHRHRNLVQLLDGMRELWTREQYAVLIEAAMPAGESLESWKKQVLAEVDGRVASGKLY